MLFRSLISLAGFMGGLERLRLSQSIPEYLLGLRKQRMKRCIERIKIKDIHIGISVYTEAA